MKTNKRIFKIENTLWEYYKNDNSTNVGLYIGLSGFILFYDSLYEVYKNDEFEEKLLEIIEKTNEIIEEQQNGIFSTLCSGIAGYGLVLSRIKNKNIDISEEYFESIDSLLLDDFIEFYESNRYDFMHEAMGVAMYFIERYKKSGNKGIEDVLLDFSKSLITKIHDNFQDILIKTNEGRGKHYSLGIAHGIAGYVNFLIYLKKHFSPLNIEISESLKICLALLHQNKKYDSRTKQYYQNVVIIDDEKGIPSRLSWCQGDLGISNAIFNAGVYLQEDSMIQESIDLMNNCARIKYEESGVVDFGFCHGTAGVLIQLFLSSKKNNIDYSAEIDRWFLVLKEQTQDFEKFPWYSNKDNKYIEEMNLLVGAAGLGLTLLTIDKKIDSNWLEIFNLH